MQKAREIPKQKKVVRQNNRLKYKQLFESGLSVAEIAAKCKVTKQCVSSLLKKAGVPAEDVYKRGEEKLMERSRQLAARDQEIVRFALNCDSETTSEALRIISAKFLLKPKTIENILYQQGVSLSRHIKEKWSLNEVGNE